ncbi:hypothetical protein [Persephonella sp. KM09-Lau-8]|uniref:hypothetical protein n=1 Tax=Persephonella sp. KM09-Lau-8 TaxID=1158345 RepID=UPI00049861A3|nr:hypothetical protein [Persephonella sp. KM09-Lau-8]
MAVIKIELEEQKIQKLRKEAEERGFKSIEEYIKFLIENKKTLPDIFYKGASKKYHITRLDREQIYDR